MNKTKIKKQNAVQTLKTEKNKTVSNDISVSDYYEIMKSENLSELEIKDKEFYLYVKRKGADEAVTLPEARPVARTVLEPEVKPLKVVAADDNEQSAYSLTVKSPIIGTFYRASSPSSASFANEGDVVNPGKTLCIVEAMKVMNEIKSEFSCKIVKILVENGKPVTSGQDLFAVERI